MDRTEENVCCVPGCNVNGASNEIKLYSFPLRNLVSRDKWIELQSELSLDGSTKVNICSEHLEGSENSDQPKCLTAQVNLREDAESSDSIDISMSGGAPEEAQRNQCQSSPKYSTEETQVSFDQQSAMKQYSSTISEKSVEFDADSGQETIDLTQSTPLTDSEELIVLDADMDQQTSAMKQSTPLIVSVESVALDAFMDQQTSAVKQSIPLAISEESIASETALYQQTSTMEQSTISEESVALDPALDQHTSAMKQRTSLTVSEESVVLDLTADIDADEMPMINKDKEYSLESLKHDWESMRLQGPHNWKLANSNIGIVLVNTENSAEYRVIDIKQDMTVEVRVNRCVAAYPKIDKIRNFSDVSQAMALLSSLQICKGTIDDPCRDGYFQPDPDSSSLRCKQCQVEYNTQIRRDYRQSKYYMNRTSETSSINPKSVRARLNQKLLKSSITPRDLRVRLTQNFQKLTKKGEPCRMDSGYELIDYASEVRCPPLIPLVPSVPEPIKIICRICLKEVPVAKNIFEDYLENNVPIHMAMRVCLYPITVSIKDSLPKHACGEFFETLNSFVKFRKSALKNEKMQRDHLAQKRITDTNNESQLKKKRRTEEISDQNRKKDNVEINNLHINSANASYMPALLNPYAKLKLQSFSGERRDDSKENITPDEEVAEFVTQPDNKGACNGTPKLEVNTIVPKTPISEERSISDRKREINLSEELHRISEQKKDGSSDVSKTVTPEGQLDGNGASNDSLNTQPVVAFCIVNGYLMEHKVMKGNFRYLKCALARCPALSKQEIESPGVFKESVVTTKRHNHAKPTETEIKKQKFISVIRRKLQISKGSSVKAIHEEVCKLYPDVAPLVHIKNLLEEVCNL